MPKQRIFNKYCNVKRIISKISINKINDTEPKVHLNYKSKAIFIKYLNLFVTKCIDLRFLSLILMDYEDSLN